MRTTSSCACPAGRYLEDQGTSAESHDSIDDCQPCPVLTYNPLTGLGDACYPCLTARSMGSVSCEGCDPGKHKVKTADGKNSSCVDCAPGMLTASRNQADCTHEQGRFAPDKGLHWDALSPREARHIDAAAQLKKTAKTALPGRFQISTAFPLQKSAAIARPAFGAISRASTRSRCANRVRPGATLRCRAPSPSDYALCASGRFSIGVAASIASTCRECPSGFAQTGNGSVYCLPCQPGTVALQPVGLLLALCEEHAPESKESDMRHVGRESSRLDLAR